MDSGNSFYSVSFLLFLCSVYVVVTINPELDHNCGWIYSYICMCKHVYVSMHSGELITVLLWKFHLM